MEFIGNKYNRWFSNISISFYYKFVQVFLLCNKLELKIEQRYTYTA